MDSKKYIGMDVHKESISIAVRNGAGKIVMECMIETKASMILATDIALETAGVIDFITTSAPWTRVDWRDHKFSIISSIVSPRGGSEGANAHSQSERPQHSTRSTQTISMAMPDYTNPGSAGDSHRIQSDISPSLITTTV